MTESTPTPVAATTVRVGEMVRFAGLEEIVREITWANGEGVGIKTDTFHGGLRWSEIEPTIIRL